MLKYFNKVSIPFYKIREKGVATSTKSKQMITGKAFEYSLLNQFKEKLKHTTNVQVITNSALTVAKDCFGNISTVAKSEYVLYASFAVNFLMDIEPRLSNDIDKKDVLQLEILADHHGKSGDVRDILAIRTLQKWEIGVSAKNNHKAVKHSRLSAKIDFGQNWLGIKASPKYFNQITPVFQKLEELKLKSHNKKKWSELGDYHSSIYVPILNAFINEIKNLYHQNPTHVARNLIVYLIGNKDFYKVIKSKNSIEIQAYNLHGTLNFPFKNIGAKYKVAQLTLPTKLLDIDFKQNSKTTVIITFDNDWALAFRIHNASSKVEASLKFDINLINSPKTLFKNTLNIISTK